MLRPITLKRGEGNSIIAQANNLKKRGIRFLLFGVNCGLVYTSNSASFEKMDYKKSDSSILFFKNSFIQLVYHSFVRMEGWGKGGDTILNIQRVEECFFFIKIYQPIGLI